MSRLLVAALIASFWLPSPTIAQQLSNEEIAAQIENARRLVAVNDDGCVKYPVGDEIVVCGENPDSKSQRAFIDRGEPDANRIRRGEAVSAVRAACCSPIPKVTPSVSAPFGYVPPVALDYEKLMKGLPEPDMVVPEGSTPE